MYRLGPQSFPLKRQLLIILITLVILLNFLKLIFIRLKVQDDNKFNKFELHKYGQ